MSRIDKEALYSSTSGFSLEDINSPPSELSGDQILIKPTMVGICGSDLFALRTFEGENFRIGHEWVGEVVATGPDSKLQIGDRVSSPAVLGCGKCDFCQEGKNNLCTQSPTLGSQDLGMLRTWVVLNSWQVAKVPNQCDDHGAALLEVAAVADEAFRLLDQLDGKKENLLIAGAGPVGVFCAIVAKERGLNYQLLEIEKERIEKAKSMGLNVLPVGQALLDTGHAGQYDALLDCSGDNNGKPGFWKYFHYFAAVGIRGIIVGKYKDDPTINSNLFAKKQALLFWMRGMSTNDLQKSIDDWAPKIKKYQADFIDNTFSLREVQKAFEFAKDRKETLKVMIKIS